MSKFDYDVIIIGAGPGGIFSAYELTKKNEKDVLSMINGFQVLDRDREVRLLN